MKKSILFIVACISLIALPVVCLAADWNLVLLLTSDLEGQLDPFKIKIQKNGRVLIKEVGGAGRLSYAISMVKKKYPGRTLTVSSGDDLMGAYFKEFQAEPIYRVMNEIGYEAGALGNHEFDFGDEFLAKSLLFSRFPIIESNLQVKPGSPLEGRFRKYAIFNRNGTEIGIFGLMNDDLALISKPGPNISVSGDFTGVAREMTNLLKKEKGVDIVVALAHIGLAESRRLAEEVPGIDVICVGNAVTLVQKGGELVKHKGDETIVVQPGEKGEYLGVLKLSFKNGKIDGHHWQPILLDEMVKKDPGVEKILEVFRQQIPADMMVTRALVPIDTRKKTLRTMEAPIGTLVTDVLRKTFKVDVAIYNGGGIRGNKVWPVGALMSSDLRTMFPFGDTVAICQMEGKVLQQAIERGVAQLPKAKGPFLQVSGIRYAIDPDGRPQELELDESGRPIGEKSPGKRIVKIEIESEDGSYIPLDPAASYKVAASTFLANGGDGYFMFKHGGWFNTEKPIRAVVEESFITREGIYPRAKGRIQYVSR